MPDDASAALDLYLCHASEDKAGFVEPLAAALQARGLRVWLDRNEIRLGDDFRLRMEDGLRRARFGVIVLSPSFRKHWPEAELSALLSQERAFGTRRVLPVVHGVSPREVASLWPFLAARSSVSSADGIPAVVEAIVAAAQDAPPPSPAARSPQYNVPRLPTQHFVGREAVLAQVAGLLTAGEDVRVAASIEGLAGIGKTELALALADHLARAGAFPGGTYWLDCADPQLETQWGGLIADELGLPGTDVPERARLVLRTLSQRAAPVLVILDNVERWSAEAEPSPLPSGSHVTLLVTTRQRRLGGTRFRHVPLEFLSDAAARELLVELSERPLAESEGFEALLRELGGHALAVELAAVTLREFPAETVAGYLAKLREGADPAAPVSELVRYERTSEATFRALWERLDEETRTVWQVMAQLEPEWVSVALLEHCTLDATRRRALARLHLVQEDPEGRCRMHRLVAGFGRRAGSEESRAEARRAFVEGVAARADEVDLETGFRVLASDPVQFERGVVEAERVLTCEAERWPCLLDRIGTAYQSAGQYSTARDLMEQALASDLETLGEVHPFVATSRSNLALVLRDLGELERARELQEQALASDLETLGEAHPSVAIRRSNLALVLLDLGELERARELLEQALESDLETLGDAHPSVATGRSNLAGVFQDLGELDRARELLEQALASDLESLGEAHPSVATSRSNLAMVLKDLGELERARELLEQALASGMETLGEAHPSVAIRRSNLALVLKDLGELERARKLLEQALASNLETLGEAHPSVAISRSNLALVLKDLGELERARELLEHALASDLERLGEAHPSVAVSRFNLADLALEGGDPQSAMRELERVAEIEELSLGPMHPTLGVTLARLALAAARCGEPERARTEADRALECVREQPAGSSDRTQVERDVAEVRRLLDGDA